jgi:anthranilate synthase component I
MRGTTSTPVGTLQLHARSATLGTVTDAEAVARVLTGFGQRMVLDPLPVNGRRGVVVAAGPLLAFTARGSRCRWVLSGRRPTVLEATGGVLRHLWLQLQQLRVDGPHLPAPLRSMFGFISYEAVRGMETLPGRHGPPVPDYQFFFPQLVVTTGDQSTRLVAYGLQPALAHDLLQTGLEAVRQAMRPPRRPRAQPEVTGVRSRSGRRRYTAGVTRAKQHLLDGDIFQVVLAVKQHLAARVDPLWLYRRLAATSPDTLRFCYLGAGFAAAGASPEPFVTVTGRRARLRPLAGTRPRGSTPAEDQRLEQQLRSSVKDLAEHRMLVDLARNDLGRVCRPGSIQVNELLAIERYTHVMHLVSNIIGELPDDASGCDVLQAAFPAGTMTGAPKIRAMEIIDALEPEARGLYAGLVGTLAPDEIHTHLNIRSAHIRPDTLTIGAGAGIVHDSEPHAEYQECLAKLRTISKLLIHPEEQT